MDIIISVKQTLYVSDLIRGMSWSLNCLSNKWKMELAC